jgi:hypothetical protein
MPANPYQPHEDAVLSEYVRAQVLCWEAVLAHLPGRSRRSASKRLQRLRGRAGTVWTVEQGRPDTGNAKLTPDRVRVIRASNASGAELARLFGVSRSTVFAARRGVHWQAV